MVITPLTAIIDFQLIPSYPLSNTTLLSAATAMFTKASGKSSVTAKVGGTTVDEAEEALVAELRKGHSFFQCPFFMHTRQYEFAMRPARDPLPSPFDLPFF